MSTFTGFQQPDFAGVVMAVEPVNDWEQPLLEEIDIDLEFEQSTLPDLVPDDEEKDEDTVDEMNTSGRGFACLVLESGANRACVCIAKSSAALSSECAVVDLRVDFA